jgi:hypothetical protein
MQIKLKRLAVAQGALVCCGAFFPGSISKVFKNELDWDWDDGMQQLKLLAVPRAILG